MDIPSLASATLIKAGENKWTVSHGSDASLFVTFSHDRIKDSFAEMEGKKPTHRWLDMIRITFPGDRTKEIYRPVQFEEDGGRPADPDRFPKQWMAFKNQTEQVQEGTPIEEWPYINKERVFDMKSLRLHTVEQIAAISDQIGPSIGMDWRKMRDMAKAFLDPGTANAQMEAMRAQILDLQNQLDTKISAPLIAASNEPAKKRGRPKTIIPQGDENAY